MKEKIVLSFLITFYNQENFVDRCLSAISQMELPFEYEVLVGDDGSTDNTLVNLNNYRTNFQNFHIFTQERKPDFNYNPIARASLNRLSILSRASGDYLVFIDGDDFVCNQEHFVKAISFLENNPQIGAFAGNFRYLNLETPDNDNSAVPNEGLISFSEYLSKYYLHVGCFIFRNTLNNKVVAKFKRLKNFDDSMIAFAFLYGGHFFFSKNVCYSYQQNQSSLWSDANQHYRDLLQVLDLDVFFYVFGYRFFIPMFRRNSSYLISLYMQCKSNKINLPEKNKKYLLDWTNDITYSFCRIFTNWEKEKYLTKLALCAFIESFKFSSKIYKKMRRTLNPPA